MASSLLPMNRTGVSGVVRELRITVAPSAARRAAIASPMPDIEPVTKATWPVNSPIISSHIVEEVLGRTL
jgi:hypothetical protein